MLLTLLLVVALVAAIVGLVRGEGPATAVGVVVLAVALLLGHI